MNLPPSWVKTPLPEKGHLLHLVLKHLLLRKSRYIDIYIYIHILDGIYLSIYLSIYPSIHPSIHPSIYVNDVSLDLYKHPSKIKMRDFTRQCLNVIRNSLHILEMIFPETKWTFMGCRNVKNAPGSSLRGSSVLCTNSRCHFVRYKCGLYPNTLQWKFIEKTLKFPTRIMGH